MPVVLGSRLERNKFTRLVQRVESDFLTPFGLATENPRSRLYQSDGYWRGPIWAPSTYLIVDGLDRGGRRDLAVEIASRFCKLVRTAGGFYENYDALTGQGLRDCGYTWTAAVTLLLISEYLT
jgi:glycogen debranching enzyme